MPITAALQEKAAQFLHVLCREIPSRRVGDPGNRQATDYFQEMIAPFADSTDTQPFDCVGWRHGETQLTVGGQAFPARVSSLSLGADLRAPLVAVASVEELSAVEARGQVLLLRGELAKEPLMPPAFLFYNPEEHQRIYALLHERAPAAIVTASPPNPDMAGGLYPYPMLEDGDFGIPSAYLSAEDGLRLAGLVGQEAHLRMEAERFPSTGCNVVARLGPGGRRVVVCAHIDSKEDTPGALDNATGVAVLLLLAELLQGRDRAPGMELVALNGEEYYSVPGQMAYLRHNEGRLGEIALAVNLDAAGYIEGRTAYSFYECPDALMATARRVLGGHPALTEGQPWPQSDHMIFAMNGVPAMALTSERLLFVENQITHTARDVPEIADPSKLVEAALGLRDLVAALAIA